MQCLVVCSLFMFSARVQPLLHVERAVLERVVGKRRASFVSQFDYEEFYYINTSKKTKSVDQCKSR